jgi:hypothetical protein
MYLFLNMLFQKQVEPRSSTPAPGGENFKARTEETDFNHDDAATPAASARKSGKKVPV